MRKGVIKVSGSMYENQWPIVSRIFRQFRPYHIEKYSVYEIEAVTRNNQFVIFNWADV